MTLALSDGARQPVSGVRPFDPGRDIGAVADVIEIAFVDELGPNDRGVLRDFRLMQLASPFLWLASRSVPDFDTVFGGFVWTEDGRIVGTVSLTRLGETGAHWLISNVGVLPEYRGRGVARSLMDAAIDTARRKGGRVITLQVRSQNERAYRLYRRLGFQLMEQTVVLDRVAGKVPSLVAPTIPLRPWTPADADRALDLAQVVVPPSYQALLPLRRAEFRFDTGGEPRNPLVEWLRGVTTYRLAVPDGDEFAALVTLKARRRGGPHQLEMSVRPRWRGQVERSLVAQTLSILARYGQRNMTADIRPDEAAAIAVLQEIGFRPMYTLDRLGLRLGP